MAEAPLMKKIKPSEEAFALPPLPPVPRKLRIALYCEGPHPLFAMGLMQLLCGNLDLRQRFELALVSDLNKEFVESWRREFVNPDPANQKDPHFDTRDATKPDAYFMDGELIDIACIVAPFGDRTLCAHIRLALVHAGVKWAVLGCRHCMTPGMPRYGSLELYHGFMVNADGTQLHPIAIQRTNKGSAALVTGYEHYWTGGNAVMEDKIRGGSDFMYVCLFDLSGTIPGKCPISEPHLLGAPPSDQPMELILRTLMETQC